MKFRKFKFITCAVASLLLLGGVLPGAVTAEAAEINPDQTNEPQPPALTEGDYAFASDLYWVTNKAYSGGSAVRDGNCAGEHIWSCDLKRFPKGIGIHAASSSFNSAYVEINIEGIGYTKFASYIGVCETLTGNDISMASVKFSVIGDGKTLFQSDALRYGQPMEFVECDITGVKTLRLAVAGAPGISGAWCVWGGAVLSKSGNTEGIEFYRELVIENPTPETEPPADTTEEITEAPTEPVTEPPTEAPTEAVSDTEAPTDAPAETSAPTETQAAGGCKASLAGTAILATSAAALVLTKRKEDERE